MLAGIFPSLHGQKSAMDALQKGKVRERLAESRSDSQKGGAPSFVLDPAWPKALPHRWIIGDVGGIYVDRADPIWVYHRPRSLGSTDSGTQGEAGKDAKGNPISALGFPRPYGQLAGCCTPAPSVLEFDKAGNLLQAWGGPGDPGFFEKKCRQQDGCVWPAREHGIYVDHNDFLHLAGNCQCRNFPPPYSSSPSLRHDTHFIIFNADGTFMLQSGTEGTLRAI